MKDLSWLFGLNICMALILGGPKSGSRSGDIDADPIKVRYPESKMKNAHQAVADVF